MAKRNPELTMAIAKRIAARRIELKLTQERAADLAGLSRPFYACIERGEKGVGADSLLKICTAFEISADYLLTGAMQPSERQYINYIKKTTFSSYGTQRPFLTLMVSEESFAVHKDTPSLSPDRPERYFGCGTGRTSPFPHRSPDGRRWWPGRPQTSIAAER